MNTKVLLVLNAIQLLPLDARDAILDLVEKGVLELIAKQRKLGTRIALNLFLSVMRHVRELTNTPDDDTNQMSPV